MEGAIGFFRFLQFLALQGIDRHLQLVDAPQNSLSHQGGFRSKKKLPNHCSCDLLELNQQSADDESASLLCLFMPNLKLTNEQYSLFARGCYIQVARPINPQPIDANVVKRLMQLIAKAPIQKGNEFWAKSDESSQPLAALCTGVMIEKLDGQWCYVYHVEESG